MQIIYSLSRVRVDLFKALVLNLTVFLLFLQSMTVFAHDQLKVNEATVINCATSKAPLDCVGDAANQCQGLHADGFDGGSTLGIKTCINHEIQIWDQLIQKHEEKLSRYYEKLDISSAKKIINRAESFKLTQASWRTHRDTECRFYYSLEQQGTIRSITFASCKLSMTAKRAVFLKDLENKN